MVGSPPFTGAIEGSPLLAGSLVGFSPLGPLEGSSSPVGAGDIDGRTETVDGEREVFGPGEVVGSGEPSSRESKKASAAPAKTGIGLTTRSRYSSPMEFCNSANV